MNKAVPALTLLAALLVAADRDKTEAARADLKKLQGTWKLAEGMAKGQPAPEDVIKDLNWVVKDDRITATGAEGKAVKLTIHLDSTGKTKAIDLTNPARKETVQGIYELSGDRWKLCVAAPGERRPAQFITKEDLKVVLFVFKRVKK
jgi:uncharacterized protein (TIGR03067 family)